MAIFRGTGGSGDSTTDTTVNTVTQLATQAQASATAAAASATAAANASTQAVANLGLTGYSFSLSGVNTGDLIHWDGSNLSPLGQASVTDGGNF